MKITGLVCEYNPLHNGHLHHLQKIRQNGADAIVAVMSGNFVQRGDVAIIDKFSRAKTAIQAGVDLVLELPVQYALAPADNFAKAAVSILDGLGNVDEISFGSEIGDMKLLEQAASACELCKTEYSDILEEFLREGTPYPVVLANMVEQIEGPEVADVLSSPNNTLAIAYINALQQLKSPIRATTIPRVGSGHDSSSSKEGEPVSASYIRQYFREGGDCHRMMPANSWHMLHGEEALGHIANIKNLERLLLYRLRLATRDELLQIAEVGQGLENRILKARQAASLEEVMEMLQTKRYPMARLRRILLHMLLGITQTDINTPPQYGRILMMNDTGRQVLHESKALRTMPFSHSPAELSKINASAARCAMLESQATDIYQLTRPIIGRGETDFRRHTAAVNAKAPREVQSHAERMD